METHIKVLGWLYIIMGVLGLVAAAIVLIVLAGTGVLSQDRTAIWVLLTIGLICAGFTAVLSIPGIIAGIGLLGTKQWGRILALVLSVLNLFNVPVGTILGIYSLYVLLDDETSRLFSGI